MAKKAWKASLAARFQQHPPWLKRSLLQALPGLALALLLALQPGLRTAAAQGAVQIASQGVDLEVVISRASSDDPPYPRDPGQGIDVAECRLSLEQGKLAKLVIYDAYPGYTCTLRVTIHNRSPQAVRLQDMKISTSPGLEIRRIDNPSTALIPAGKKSQQAFQIRIQGQAIELGQLEFQIAEVYVPVEASLSTR